MSSLSPEPVARYVFKLMVILNQLGMPTCCQLTVYKFPEQG